MKFERVTPAQLHEVHKHARLYFRIFIAALLSTLCVYTFLHWGPALDEKAGLLVVLLEIALACISLVALLLHLECRVTIWAVQKFEEMNRENEGEQNNP